jgi:hypothetical protein
MKANRFLIDVIKLNDAENNIQLVLIFYLLKYCKRPTEAKNVEISIKRKRGRRSKAKKALLMQ